MGGWYSMGGVAVLPSIYVVLVVGHVGRHFGAGN